LGVAWTAVNRVCPGLSVTAGTNTGLDEAGAMIVENGAGRGWDQGGAAGVVV
jgi:hypothetical protein